MTLTLLNSVLTLALTGAVAGAVLYLAARKFYVFEDPKIDEIEGVLPAANCGGCGYAGCRNFAEAVVKTKDLDRLFCPVGGNDCQAAMAKLLGIEVSCKEREIAVLACNGSLKNAPPKVEYRGISSCQLGHNQYAGSSGCPYGCLGLGDCVVVCGFDALKVDESTGLPVVDSEKCTACGACVTACPRDLFSLRTESQQGNGRVYVACKNQEKGAAAKKSCSVACIGCSKCLKVVKDDETNSSRVKINNFLSTIENDIDVKKYGEELVACCPTKAILGVGLPSKEESHAEEI